VKSVRMGRPYKDKVCVRLPCNPARL
jgi:hypothetical protein